jgi:hypothetical protein
MTRPPLRCAYKQALDEGHSYQRDHYLLQHVQLTSPALSAAVPVPAVRIGYVPLLAWAFLSTLANAAPGSPALVSMTVFF